MALAIKNNKLITIELPQNVQRFNFINVFN